MSASAHLPRRVSTAEAVVVDGRAVIYDTEARTLHVLNETGTRVWQRCDGTTRLGDVARPLANEFDMPIALVLDEVRALVDELVASGIATASEN